MKFALDSVEIVIIKLTSGLFDFSGLLWFLFSPIAFFLPFYFTLFQKNILTYERHKKGKIIPL